MELPQRLADAYAAAGNALPPIIEISSAAYDEALGALPPIHRRGEMPPGSPFGRFWVGEIHHHDAAGQPVSLECWRDGQQFFCRLSPIPPQEK